MPTRILNPLRDQFLLFWKNQSRIQRIVLIALVVTGLVASAAFIAWASTPTYAVAFKGLSDADAGPIVDKLKAANIPYQLQDGGTILVPSNQVYEVRLSMASQGLLQNGTVGFEIFSGTTLGMTEFTQRVNYQRALEGELERTIGSLTAIQAVRVHIVTPEKAVLSADQAPTTASITLKLKPGNTLQAGQVSAITHLVAASVEGMKPENVVVLDSNGNMLAGGGAEGLDANTSPLSETHRAAEAAQAAQVESKVRNLLDTVLGPNKSVVKASVAMDWTQRDITRQTVDPQQSALRSAQTLTETYNGNGLATGGIPGSLTNLPPLSMTSTLSGTAGTYYWRQENTSNYEMTQVQAHEIAAPGQIANLSLSVMVDGVTDTKRLQSLRTVIAAAAGIQQTRGDVLAVETLNFDRTYYDQQTAQLQQDSQMELYWKIGLTILAVLLLAALLWYIQRLLNNLRLASAEAWTPVLMPAGALTAGGSSMAGLTPGAAAALGAAPTPVTAGAEPGKPAKPAKPEQPVSAHVSEEDEQIERLLVRLAEENPSTVAEVIQMWLSQDGK